MSIELSGPGGKKRCPTIQPPLGDVGPPVGTEIIICSFVQDSVGTIFYVDPCGAILEFPLGGGTGGAVSVVTPTLANGTWNHFDGVAINEVISSTGTAAGNILTVDATNGGSFLDCAAVVACVPLENVTLLPAQGTPFAGMPVGAPPTPTEGDVVHQQFSDTTAQCTWDATTAQWLCVTIGVGAGGATSVVTPSLAAGTWNHFDGVAINEVIASTGTAAGNILTVDPTNGGSFLDCAAVIPCVPLENVDVLPTQVVPFAGVPVGPPPTPTEGDVVHQDFSDGTAQCTWDATTAAWQCVFVSTATGAVSVVTPNLPAGSWNHFDGVAINETIVSTGSTTAGNILTVDPLDGGSFLDCAAVVPCIPLEEVTELPTQVTPFAGVPVGAPVSPTEGDVVHQVFSDTTAQCTWDATTAQWLCLTTGVAGGGATSVVTPTLATGTWNHFDGVATNEVIASTGTAAGNILTVDATNGGSFLDCAAVIPCIPLENVDLLPTQGVPFAGVPIGAPATPTEGDVVHQTFSDTTVQCTWDATTAQWLCINIGGGNTSVVTPTLATGTWVHDDGTGLNNQTISSTGTAAGNILTVDATNGGSFLDCTAVVACVPLENVTELPTQVTPFAGVPVGAPVSPTEGDVVHQVFSDTTAQCTWDATTAQWLCVTTGVSGGGATSVVTPSLALGTWNHFDGVATNEVIASTGTAAGNILTVDVTNGGSFLDCAAVVPCIPLENVDVLTPQVIPFAGVPVGPPATPTEGDVVHQTFSDGTAQCTWDATTAAWQCVFVPDCASAIDLGTPDALCGESAILTGCNAATITIYNRPTPDASGCIDCIIDIDTDEAYTFCDTSKSGTTGSVLGTTGSVTWTITDGTQTIANLPPVVQALFAAATTQSCVEVKRSTFVAAGFNIGVDWTITQTVTDTCGGVSETCSVTFNPDCIPGGGVACGGVDFGAPNVACGEAAILTDCAGAATTTVWAKPTPHENACVECFINAGSNIAYRFEDKSKSGVNGVTLGTTGTVTWTITDGTQTIANLPAPEQALFAAATTQSSIEIEQSVFIAAGFNINVPWTITHQVNDACGGTSELCTVSFSADCIDETGRGLPLLCTEVAPTCPASAPAVGGGVILDDQINPSKTVLDWGPHLPHGSCVARVSDPVNGLITVEDQSALTSSNDEVVSLVYNVSDGGTAAPLPSITAIGDTEVDFDAVAAGLDPLAFPWVVVGTLATCQGTLGFTCPVECRPKTCPPYDWPDTSLPALAFGPVDFGAGGTPENDTVGEVSWVATHPGSIPAGNGPFDGPNPNCPHISGDHYNTCFTTADATMDWALSFARLSNFCLSISGFRAQNTVTFTPDVDIEIVLAPTAPAPTDPIEANGTPLSAIPFAITAGTPVTIVSPLAPNSAAALCNSVQICSTGTCPGTGSNGITFTIGSTTIGGCMTVYDLTGTHCASGVSSCPVTETDVFNWYTSNLAVNPEDFRTLYPDAVRCSGDWVTACGGLYEVSDTVACRISSASSNALTCVEVADTCPTAAPVVGGGVTLDDGINPAKTVRDWGSHEPIGVCTAVITDAANGLVTVTDLSSLTSANDELTSLVYSISDGGTAVPLPSITALGDSQVDFDAVAAGLDAQASPWVVIGTLTTCMGTVGFTCPVRCIPQECPAYEFPVPLPLPLTAFGPVVFGAGGTPEDGSFEEISWDVVHPGLTPGSNGPNAGPWATCPAQFPNSFYFMSWTTADNLVDMTFTTARPMDVCFNLGNFRATNTLVMTVDAAVTISVVNQADPGTFPTLVQGVPLTAPVTFPASTVIQIEPSPGTPGSAAHQCNTVQVCTANGCSEPATTITFQGFRGAPSGDGIAIGEMSGNYCAQTVSDVCPDEATLLSWYQSDAAAVPEDFRSIWPSAVRCGSDCISACGYSYTVVNGTLCRKACPCNHVVCLDACFDVGALPAPPATADFWDTIEFVTPDGDTIRNLTYLPDSSLLTSEAKTTFAPLPRLTAEGSQMGVSLDLDNACAGDPPAPTFTPITQNSCFNTVQSSIRVGAGSEPVVFPDLAQVFNPPAPLNVTVGSGNNMLFVAVILGSESSGLRGGVINSVLDGTGMAGLVGPFTEYCFEDFTAFTINRQMRLFGAPILGTGAGTVTYTIDPDPDPLRNDGSGLDGMHGAQSWQVNDVDTASPFVQQGVFPGFTAGDYLGLNGSGFDTWGQTGGFAATPQNPTMTVMSGHHNFNPNGATNNVCGNYNTDDFGGQIGGQEILSLQGGTVGLCQIGVWSVFDPLGSTTFPITRETNSAAADLQLANIFGYCSFELRSLAATPGAVSNFVDVSASINTPPCCDPLGSYSVDASLLADIIFSLEPGAAYRVVLYINGIPVKTVPVRNDGATTLTQAIGTLLSSDTISPVACGATENVNASIEIRCDNHVSGTLATVTGVLQLVGNSN